jgi:uncharacterized membrane protein
MSRKFIEKEGPRWIAQGIVNSEQYNQILGLYEDKKRVLGLLPVFGSILVGLGILTYVASNWQQIPDFWRLTLLISLMASLYGIGDYYHKKQHVKFGISFIGIGLIAFGANIILIAQMFNIEAYSILSFIVWGLIGLLLTFIYQSRYLFLLTLLIFTIAQLTSVANFQQFSYTEAVIMIAGLGSYLWLNRSLLLSWAFSISFIVHAILFVTTQQFEFIWVFVPILILYVCADGIKDSRLAAPFQISAIASLILFYLFIVLFTNDGLNIDVYVTLSEQYGLLITILVLFVISLFLKLNSSRGASAWDWILSPLIVFLPNYMDLFGIMILFLFSLFVLWRGYVEHWDVKINVGTILFLLTTMIAYSKLTWDFMDRSLFFTIGGMLLLALSWFLNRRKKDFLKDIQGGPEHE